MAQEIDHTTCVSRDVYDHWRKLAEDAASDEYVKRLYGQLHLCRYKLSLANAKLNGTRQHELNLGLRRKLSMAHGAFFDYGWHIEDCPAFDDQQVSDQCNCGFSEIFTALSTPTQGARRSWYDIVKKRLIESR